MYYYSHKYIDTSGLLKNNKANLLITNSNTHPYIPIYLFL